MMENSSEEILDEAKAPSADGAIKQRIKSRVSLVKNRLKVPVNATVAATGLTDYVNLSQKNPKLSHYGILQKLSGQKRDAVSQINSAVPIPMIVNAPDSQLRRALRDIVKEQMELNEAAFNPPAMLLLKRQAIRVFPNGQRIALYMDNKYGLTFPVPYDESGSGFVAGTGKVSAIKGYVNEESYPIVFSTGEETLVERHVIDKINEVYSSLNEENKEKFSDMILESEESFNKAKDFALSI